MAKIEPQITLSTMTKNRNQQTWQLVLKVLANAFCD
jgi:hypothetical protein